MEDRLFFVVRPTDEIKTDMGFYSGQISRFKIVVTFNNKLLTNVSHKNRIKINLL